MRRREQQQIPFGKDRQKNKGNGKIKDRADFGGFPHLKIEMGGTR